MNDSRANSTKRTMKSLVNHYVYKHSVMHFRDDGKHHYSLVKLTCPEAVKYCIRTLIKPAVY